MTDQELLDRIRKKKSYPWKSVYFHELNNPDFKAEFESLIRSVSQEPDKVIQGYQDKVNEYEAWYKEQCRPAAEWLIRQINEEQERRERKVKDWKKQKEHYLTMSDSELLKSWQQGI